MFIVLGIYNFERTVKSAFGEKKKERTAWENDVDKELHFKWARFPL